MLPLARSLSAPHRMKVLGVDVPNEAFALIRLFAGPFFFGHGEFNIGQGCLRSDWHSGASALYGSHRSALTVRAASSMMAATSLLPGSHKAVHVAAAISIGPGNAGADDAPSIG